MVFYCVSKLLAVLTIGVLNVFTVITMHFTCISFAFTCTHYTHHISLSPLLTAPCSLLFRFSTTSLPHFSYGRSLHLGFGVKAPNPVPPDPRILTQGLKETLSNS
jgi:hypothetical protein